MLRQSKRLLVMTLSVLMVLTSIDIQSFATSKTEAPVLKSLNVYTIDGKTESKLKWGSVNRAYYGIYRKAPKGRYHRIAVVRGKSTYTTYSDKKMKTRTDYTYTVRRLAKPIKTKKIIIKGAYDKVGITAMSVEPEIKVDFSNRRADITWKPVGGASKYIVYRKFEGKAYERLSTLESDTTEYEDVYGKSFSKTEKSDYLYVKNLMDPSNIKVSYMVRAVSENDGKTSYGNYSVKGVFKLSEPTIISASVDLDKVSIKWSDVPFANKYYIYSGYKNDADAVIKWKKIGVVADGDVTLATHKAKLVCPEDNYVYFTVKAVSDTNGIATHSNCEKNFRIDRRNYSDHNVLFLGDSITFGSPYKSYVNRYIYSYPWRVSQLTGIHFYNPSIPGATLAYKESNSDYHRYRIVTDVADKLSKGWDPYTPAGLIPPNKSKSFADYDTIVIAAGTNDYSDSIPVGNVNSSDISTYSGAMNHIVNYVKEANRIRINEGKRPIKLVFMNLFYSNRVGDRYSETINRFTYSNEIGLTLSDYQKSINELVKSYQSYYKSTYDESDNDEYVMQFNTEKYVNQATCQYKTSDNLHMTKNTYAEIGNDLSEYLIDNVFN